MQGCGKDISFGLSYGRSSMIRHGLLPVKVVLKSLGVGGHPPGQLLRLMVQFRTVFVGFNTRHLHEYSVRG
jgi:hypothetical protein